MIETPCGCVLDTDANNGVIFSVRKCTHHLSLQRSPSSLGAEYYRELGLIDSQNRLRPTSHVHELIDALGPLPENKRVLEIGCGTSPYAKSLIERGNEYRAIEPSPFASHWMRLTYGPCQTASIERCENWMCDVVLAAHALEHIVDEERALANIKHFLRDGGELWLIVPEGTDLMNPDHLLFFTEESLSTVLTGSGFQIDIMVTKQIVPHERFIYVRCRVPSR